MKALNYEVSVDIEETRFQPLLDAWSYHQFVKLPKRCPITFSALESQAVDSQKSGEY